MDALVADLVLTSDTFDPFVGAEMVEFIDPDSGRRMRMPLSPLQAGVSIGRAGSFPPRNVIGDANLVKHDWLSQLVQNNWQGGGQRTEADEATTMQRYAGIATLDSRWPEMLCLLPKTTTLVGPNEDGFMPLGDLTVAGDTTFYCAFGTKLCSVDPTTFVVTTEATLDEAPVSTGVKFKGTGTLRLFIPQSGGYQTWDGSTLSAAVSSFQPVSMACVNNVLYALESDCSIWDCATGVAGDWAPLITIDGGAIGHKLGSFRDASGNPTLVVVTDIGLYTIDVGGPTIYETDVDWPKHPSSGRTMAKWRQDLFIAYGIDTVRYTLGTVNYVGLARDDSVPTVYRGATVSMCNGYNDLWCLIEGASSLATVERTWSWGDDFTDDWAFFESDAYTTLMRLDGYLGWHTGWYTSELGDPPTEVTTSAAQEVWNLYWGFNGKGLTQELSREFQNPLHNPAARFERAGQLVSQWYDNGQPGVQFLLVGMLVRTELCGEDETITIEYQIDDETNPWNLVTIIDNQDETGFRFFQINDCGILPDGSTYYRGDFYYRVRYRVTMTTAEDDCTPVLKAIGFIYMPVMGSLLTFNFRVDCSSDEMNNADGLSNADRAAFLDRLPQARLIPMAYRGVWYTVKVSGSTGFDATGLDWRGDREVSAIEAFHV